LGDYLGRRSMVAESPAFSGWNTSGSHRGLDLPPGAAETTPAEVIGKPAMRRTSAVHVLQL
jgi:hypothetical protein